MTTASVLVIVALISIVAGGSIFAIMHMTRQGVPRRSVGTWLIAARHGLVDVVGQTTPSASSAATDSSVKSGPSRATSSAAPARDELISH